MKTPLIAALLLLPSSAGASAIARRYDLHCDGKAEHGQSVQHWLSIDPHAPRWCFRATPRAACALQPFTADGDSLSATSDDPDATRTYSFQVDTKTGAYSYDWDYAPHPSEDGRNPTRVGSDKGHCTRAAFTPYRID